MKTEIPYISGFLAYREFPTYKKLMDRVPSKYTPQV